MLEDNQHLLDDHQHLWDDSQNTPDDHLHLQEVHKQQIKKHWQCNQKTKNYYLSQQNVLTMMQANKESLIAPKQWHITWNHI